MEIVCKNCNTSHYLSDDRIPLETKTGKCKQCSAPITVLGKNALGSIELSLTQSTPPEPEATKNCDFCGEKILAIAKKCQHCGSMLDGSHVANSQSAVEADIKPAEEITPPHTDDFVDNTLSYKVDRAIKKAVNTLMTRLTVFYSSYRTKNNTHNLQEISETLNKFAWFELIKNHSLKSKIIYIAVIVAILIAVITIGLFNLFVILVMLLPVLWIVSLFKPRIVLANTRSDATKRIIIACVVVFIGGAITSPPKDNVAVAPVNQAIQADEVNQSTATNILKDIVEVKQAIQQVTTIQSTPKNIVKDTDLVFDNNNIAYAPNNKDVPFTGRHEKNYSNGQKKLEANYKDGLRDGLFTEWRENGQKETERNYNSGDMVWAIVTTYYGNGQKVRSEERKNKNGMNDGFSTEWYENGQKRSEHNIANGHRNGLSTEWYENGQKIREENYTEGRRDGLSTAWYENGQKSFEGSYKENGRAGYDGLITSWYGNGQKRSEQTYKEGYLDGLSTEWYENGQKKEEVNAKNRQMEVLITTWDVDGKKATEINYKKGELHGLSTHWYRDGRNPFAELYKNGVRIRIVSGRVIDGQWTEVWTEVTEEEKRELQE